MSTEFQDAHLAEVKPLVEKEEVIILNIFKAFVSSFSVPVATVHVFLVLTSCMERQMRNWWCNNSVLDICWCWGMTVLLIRHNWVLIIALALCIFNADLLWTYIYTFFWIVTVLGLFWIVPIEQTQVDPPIPVDFSVQRFILWSILSLSWRSRHAERAFTLLLVVLGLKVWLPHRVCSGCPMTAA